MRPDSDFDRLAVYGTLAGITSFIHEIEDRFPADEVPTLYKRMLVAAIDAGAQLASGYARDGLDEAGMLSVATRHEVGARLSELKHYILTAARGYILDEKQVSRFEALYGQALDALETRAELR